MKPLITILALLFFLPAVHADTFDVSGSLTFASNNGGSSEVIGFSFLFIASDGSSTFGTNVGYIVPGSEVVSSSGPLQFTDLRTGFIDTDPPVQFFSSDAEVDMRVSNSPTPSFFAALFQSCDAVCTQDGFGGGFAVPIVNETDTPESSTLSMLSLALGAIGLAGWRNRRKPTKTIFQSQAATVPL